MQTLQKPSPCSPLRPPGGFDHSAKEQCPLYREIKESHLTQAQNAPVTCPRHAQGLAMRRFAPASGLLLLLPLALIVDLASASPSYRVLQDDAARGRQERAQRSGSQRVDNDRGWVDSQAPRLRMGPANVSGTYHGED